MFEVQVLMSQSSPTQHASWGPSLGLQTPVPGCHDLRSPVAFGNLRAVALPGPTGWFFIAWTARYRGDFGDLTLGPRAIEKPPQVLHPTRDISFLSYEKHKTPDLGHIYPHTPVTSNTSNHGIAFLLEAGRQVVHMLHRQPSVTWPWPWWYTLTLFFVWYGKHGFCTSLFICARDSSVLGIGGCGSVHSVYRSEKRLAEPNPNCYDFNNL